MLLKLAVNSCNPPTDVLIAAEIVNSQKNGEIEVQWYKDNKKSNNVRLSDEGGNLLGETSHEVGRYFARTINGDLYGGTTPIEKTQVDHWLTFAIGPLKSPVLKDDILAYLNRVLMTSTWLVSDKLTLADICVFCALLSKQFLEKYGKDYPCITRWYKHMLSLPEVEKALHIVSENMVSVPEKAQTESTSNQQTSARKQEGKFIELPGAEMGKVVVRFPPEASGYLHIGHAKAALLNQYYAEAFQGELIMRYDDTNPAKENVEFERAILEDLELLHIKPNRFTHSSDYFDLMLQYCTKLIEEGKAYVDDTPALIMKEQREQKQMSSSRENSIEKNIELWNEMKNGTAKGQECCVRAKIDYQSVNGCLRDPTIYRCKPEPHPRTGTKYKVYPTYDFACPIVDAVEGVTHTLRTTEYHDRDAQFYWLIEALGLRRPYIWEYSRLNMTNTVLSKRKLTWFVTENQVDGWDDPRFPTVRGILRRGMTVEGLKQFIIAQGSSRSVVFMEWDKIWAFNKKVIDPIAIRYTTLNAKDTVEVHVRDAKEEWLTVQNHPKDPSIGTKRVKVGPKVLIEKCDAEALKEGQNTTFINWGNLFIEKIEKKSSEITKVVARLNLEDKNYKNTLKVTWLAVPSNANDDCDDNHTIPCYAVYFDHIISKAVLGKDDDFKDFVAKNTRWEVEMIGEPELKRVKKDEIIQVQRKGFFRCDVPYGPTSSVSSREQPIVLFHIPDGHATSSTSVSKPATQDTVAKPTSSQSAEELDKKISAQGDKVRQLKAEKADKATVDAAVKLLLALKNEFKAATGADWKPGAQNTPKSNAQNADALNEQIAAQGEKVRQLKGKKADKATVDAEVKILLALKADYKAATGTDWKPGAQNVQKCENQSPDTLNQKIVAQGDKVRQLKAEKADKAAVDAEVKLLLALKNDYKAATGTDWKPGAHNVQKREVQSADALNEKIAAQGEKVRQLKAGKADKATVDAEVKVLLALKNDYKAATGIDWKPGAQKSNVQKSEVVTATPENAKSQTLSDKIKEQDRKLKELQALIESESKQLDKLKEEYKDSTGKSWLLGDTEVVSNKRTPGESLSDEIQKQGDKVRELKSAKADKETIDKEVKVLLQLKEQYKAENGTDWKPKSSPKTDEPAKKKKKTEDSKKPAKSAANKNNQVEKVDEKTKTGTRLGLEVKKEENFFEWYSQVITKAGMIEYYDVSGCYILRPWSFNIWKVIKNYIEEEISKLGVQECYFPIFVTRAVLEKEKAHIADFAPEVAWVTKCGESDLAEPIAIRPTSETVMYPAYAKWLRSDTELPLRLNQWNNVVRWEFKDPKPFLRTREFLWQEGHTAFATKAEADEEVLIILDMYARVYENLLAVPVIKGRKTEKEKFAGGDYTTTVEAFISTSGRAIQGATSHHLGQNFSKMFNIQVEGATESDEKTFVYQNSWGLTTRTIGVMIMVHGDDKGLVLPPNVAAIQAVLIPCGITASTTAAQRDNLLTECDKLLSELSKDGKVRVKADVRNNRTPGWKFNHWELKGVPVRVELGPKDLEKNQVTFVRRDNSDRIAVPRVGVLDSLQKLLNEIQTNMLERAKEKLNGHIIRTESFDTFNTELNKKNLILSPFCGVSSCEDNIKADSAREDSGEELGALSMGAKSLCIPFEQPSVSLDKAKCIHPKCRNKPKFYTLFGRSY